MSRLTGLTPDVIRVWEKRYEVVAPVRGPRGARLYSSADVARLRLLGQIVAGGHSIGDIAHLPAAELEQLLSPAYRGREQAATSPHPASAHSDLTSQILTAAKRFDATLIERLLGDALVASGVRRFTREVVAPLLTAVGAGWSRSEVMVAEEHLISSIVRQLLLGLIRLRARSDAPLVLLTTPAGDPHEFGMMLATLTLLDCGINVSYLGVGLPAVEIAHAAHATKSAVVALSVVDANNRPQAVQQIQDLELHLPERTEIWLGGRDASPTRDSLVHSRAIILTDLDSIEVQAGRLLREAISA